MQTVKMKATRTTSQYKVGQTITVNPVIGKLMVRFGLAKYDDEEVKAEPARKKRTYKRRDMQAE